MTRRRWLVHLIFRALMYRRGRTALLLVVLAMASSLATALGIVSFSMGQRVADEVRKYGANLVVLPETARLDVGSGGLSFGAITEPAYLKQEEVEMALARSGIAAERSSHLRGALRFRNADILVEGVNFGEIRRLLPWWQLRGGWPAAGEGVVGSDLATRFHLKEGEVVELVGPRGPVRLRLSGIVTSGGEEDGLLFLNLPELQSALELQGELSTVRLLVSAEGGSLGKRAALLQQFLTGAKVTEVRQIARTSEGLLAKVKLLMLLVTVVVLVSAGSSVTGTMSTTVLERSREIGLMKAMGGSRWELLRIFAAEAFLLGIAGGLVGYLLGCGIAQFITVSVFSASARITPWFAVVSLGVSILLALLGSLGPMISVFRLDPVRSLRGE